MSTHYDHWNFGLLPGAEVHEFNEFATDEDRSRWLLAQVEAGRMIIDSEKGGFQASCWLRVGDRLVWTCDNQIQVDSMEAFRQDGAPFRTLSEEDEWWPVQVVAVGRGAADAGGGAMSGCANLRTGLRPPLTRRSLDALARQEVAAAAMMRPFPPSFRRLGDGPGVVRQPDRSTVRIHDILGFVVEVRGFVYPGGDEDPELHCHDCPLSDLVPLTDRQAAAVFVGGGAEGA